MRPQCSFYSCVIQRHRFSGHRTKLIIDTLTLTAAMTFHSQEASSLLIRCHLSSSGVIHPFPASSLLIRRHLSSSGVIHPFPRLLHDFSGFHRPFQSQFARTSGNLPASHPGIFRARHPAVPPAVHQRPHSADIVSVFSMIMELIYGLFGKPINT